MKLLKIIFLVFIVSIAVAGCNNGGENPGEDHLVKPNTDTVKVPVDSITVEKIQKK